MFCVCMHHLLPWGPKKSEEGIRCPVTAVIDGYESFARAMSALTTEPSLASLMYFL